MSEDIVLFEGQGLTVKMVADRSNLTGPTLRFQHQTPDGVELGMIFVDQLVMALTDWLDARGHVQATAEEVAALAARVAALEAERFGVGAIVGLERRVRDGA